MAYSEIEQITRDLDVFFSDDNKLIHLATAGGILPNFLTTTDVYNDQILESIANINPDFEIDINPELAQLLNLTEGELDDYLVSFVEMAKKGFYTYDKTLIGEKEDMTFHLVAKPASNIKLSSLYKMYRIEQIINSNLPLPDKFTTFNLNQLIP